MRSELQRSAPVLGLVALVVVVVMALAVSAASLAPRSPTGDATGRSDKQAQIEKREAKRQARLERQRAKLERRQARLERRKTGQRTGQGAAKTPESAIHVTGVVAATTAADGTVDYAVLADGKTYRLSAGPAWWWGADHPLARVVGHSVTIDGMIAAASDKIDVLAIDGTAIRSRGRPPWAGGWMVVGDGHPGSEPLRTAPAPTSSPAASHSPTPTP